MTEEGGEGGSGVKEEGVGWGGTEGLFRVKRARGGGRRNEMLGKKRRNRKR